MPRPVPARKGAAHSSALEPDAEHEPEEPGECGLEQQQIHHYGKESPQEVPPDRCDRLSAAADDAVRSKSQGGAESYTFETGGYEPHSSTAAVNSLPYLSLPQSADAANHRAHCAETDGADCNGRSPIAGKKAPRRVVWQRLQEADTGTERGADQETCTDSLQRSPVHASADHHVALCPEDECGRP